MTYLRRFARSLAKPRSLIAASVACAAAAATLLLAAGHDAPGSASAATAPAARYAALASRQPSGLTLVTSHGASGSATPHPTWPAQPPPGAGLHWPDAATIRRLSLTTPGVSGWIAASTEGGVCILIYDGEPVEGNAAVYAGCSPEGRLDRGAAAEIRDIPGRPGVSIDAGVVPDGVSAVTLTLADGSTETLPVHGNAWARESEDPIAAGRRPAWTTGG